MAEHLWLLAAVGQARAFEGPAADYNAPAAPFRSLPIAGRPRRAGEAGNLLADLFTARARARTHDYVRLPPPHIHFEVLPIEI